MGQLRKSLQLPKIKDVMDFLNQKEPSTYGFKAYSYERNKLGKLKSDPMTQRSPKLKSIKPPQQNSISNQNDLSEGLFDLSFIQDFEFQQKVQKHHQQFGFQKNTQRNLDTIFKSHFSKYQYTERKKTQPKLSVELDNFNLNQKQEAQIKRISSRAQSETIILKSPRQTQLNKNVSSTSIQKNEILAPRKNSNSRIKLQNPNKQDLKQQIKQQQQQNQITNNNFQNEFQKNLSQIQSERQYERPFQKIYKDIVRQNEVNPNLIKSEINSLDDQLKQIKHNYDKLNSQCNKNQKLILNQISQSINFDENSKNQN